MQAAAGLLLMGSEAEAKADARIAGVEWVRGKQWQRDEAAETLSYGCRKLGGKIGFFGH